MNRMWKLLIVVMYSVLAMAQTGSQGMSSAPINPSCLRLPTSVPTAVAGLGTQVGQPPPGRP